MQIIKCVGEELEKEKKNSPEDFFNQSTITYFDKGNEHTFRVLYIRFFEEDISTYTPFTQNPIITVNHQTFDLKDIVALVKLIKDPGVKNKKRVYINQQEEFEALFQNIRWDMVKKVCLQITEGTPYNLESTLEFITS